MTRSFEAKLVLCHGFNEVMRTCFIRDGVVGLCVGLQSLRVGGNPQKGVRPQVLNKGTKSLISYLFGRMQKAQQETLKRERDCSTATYVEFRNQQRPAVPQPRQYTEKYRKEREGQDQRTQQQPHSPSRIFDLGQVPRTSQTKPVNIAPDISGSRAMIDKELVFRKLDFVCRETGQPIEAAQFLLLQAQGDPKLAVEAFFQQRGTGPRTQPEVQAQQNGQHRLEPQNVAPTSAVDRQAKFQQYTPQTVDRRQPHRYSNANNFTDEFDDFPAAGLSQGESTNRDQSLDEYRKKMEEVLTMENVVGARAATLRSGEQPSSGLLQPPVASQAKRVVKPNNANDSGFGSTPRPPGTDNFRKDNMPPRSAAQPNFAKRTMSWGGGPSSIAFGTDGDPKRAHARVPSHSIKSVQRGPSNNARKVPPAQASRSRLQVTSGNEGSESSIMSPTKSPLSDCSWGGGRTSIQVVGSGMTSKKTLRGRRTVAKSTDSHQSGRKSACQVSTGKESSYHTPSRDAALALAKTAVNPNPVSAKSRGAPRGHAKLSKHHSWGGGPSSFNSVGDFGGSGPRVKKPQRSAGAVELEQREFHSPQHANASENNHCNGHEISDTDHYHDLCDEIQMIESKIGGIGVHMPGYKHRQLKKTLAKKRLELRRMVGK